MIRLLKMDRGFELLLLSQEEFQEDAQLDIPMLPKHYAHHIEIKNALLEADYRKAQGLREWERSCRNPV